MNHLNKMLLILLVIFNSHSAENLKVYPAPLLSLDSFFAHHVLVAEKSTHLLHLFKNNDGYPELVKSYQMVTGKKSGDKLQEGDLKTPEGIYNFIDFMTKKELLEKNGKEAIIYGAGAFVTDYPNPIDSSSGKNGSGIWLHSTNDETRLDKGLDSKGCVVTANLDLIDTSKYLELYKTPIVIVQDLLYLNEKTYHAKRNDLKTTVDGWLSAWRNKDIEKYISFYHPQEFKDSKGNYSQYKAYKSAVFSNPGKPTIDLNFISILEFKSYAVVSFSQKYQSQTINDTGKKTLYLIQDSNYQWKIVREQWSKLGLQGIENQTAFEPSLRFFKEGVGIEISKDLKIEPTKD